MSPLQKERVTAQQTCGMKTFGKNMAFPEIKTCTNALSSFFVLFFFCFVFFFFLVNRPNGIVPF